MNQEHNKKREASRFPFLHPKQDLALIIFLSQFVDMVGDELGLVCLAGSVSGQTGTEFSVLRLTIDQQGYRSPGGQPFM